MGIPHHRPGGACGRGRDLTPEPPDLPGVREGASEPAERCGRYTRRIRRSCQRRPDTGRPSPRSRSGSCGRCGRAGGGAHLPRPPRPLLRRGEPGSDFLTFSAKDADPGVADRLAMAYARAYVDYRFELDSQAIARARASPNVKRSNSTRRGSATAPRSGAWTSSWPRSTELRSRRSWSSVRRTRPRRSGRPLSGTAASRSSWESSSALRSRSCGTSSTRACGRSTRSETRFRGFRFSAASRRLRGRSATETGW